MGTWPQGLLQLLSQTGCLRTAHSCSVTITNQPDIVLQVSVLLNHLPALLPYPAAAGSAGAGAPRAHLLVQAA